MGIGKSIVLYGLYIILKPEDLNHHLSILTGKWYGTLQDKYDQE